MAYLAAGRVPANDCVNDFGNSGEEFVRRGFGLALSTVMAASLALPVAADTQSDPQKIVDDRVAAMKAMAGKVNEAFQLSGTDASEARAKLAAALAIAESIPSRFPKGTADGDPGVTTRALPAIWSDGAGFAQRAAALAAAMKAVDARLAAGDAAGAEAAFGDVRKTCGGCHEPYRGPAK
jgi:cytochrome c556